MTADWLNLTSNQPRTKWSLELGYNDLRNEMPYPFRVSGSGTQFSLQIVLKVLNDDIDHLCGGGHHGFKITFNEPSESVQILRKYYEVGLNRMAMFTIDPKLIITSSDVHEYKPNVRGCYLSSERHLKYFKHYSQRNCEVECVTNFTLAQCGCVRFSMPSETNNYSYDFNRMKLVYS